MKRLASLLILSFVACAATPNEGAHPLAGAPIELPNPPLPGQVDLPRFPSISPDGQAICFSWRGDLWRVNTAGGQATRLTAHPMLDDHSIWSPDGKQIAFNSERSGYRNVYRMNADGTALAPVTREDRTLLISDWADDGTLALTAFLEADIHKSPRPYRLSSTGGPITRIHDAFGRSAVTSPDGRHIAFVRGRASWTKPFATNSDNRDLWLFDREDKTFQRLTVNPGNDGKPRWLDNDTLIYLSARPPARTNLYKIDIDKSETQARVLTAFDEDVQAFDVARDGNTAVMHVWDKLYRLDLGNPNAKPEAISITAPTDADDLRLLQKLEGNANDAALSPDGKVVAVNIHGELFIRTIDSKNPPQRISNHVALDDHPTWSPDGRTLYFTSDRDGTLSIYQAKVTLTRQEIEKSIEMSKNALEVINPDNDTDEKDQSLIETEPAVDETEEEPTESESKEKTDKEADEQEPDTDASTRWQDAIRFEITPVIQTEHHDTDPSPAPNGKSIAFRRGNGMVMIHDLVNGENRIVLEGWDSRTHWAWSADSKTLAIAYADQDHNTDIWVGPADGSTPLTNITKHPAGDMLPSFSSDGKILTFISARQDDQYDIYAVYLDKTIETYTPQQLADYYKKATTDAKKRNASASKSKKKDEASDAAGPEGEAVAEDQAEAEVEPEENIATPMDLDDAYLRLRRLTSTSGNEWDARVLPGGDRVVYSRDDDVYTIGWDGKDEKKIGDNLDFRQLSHTGSHIAAIRNGSAVVVATDGGKTNNASVSGTITVNRQLQQKQRFIECSRAISMSFYDGSFKGIDWPGATQKYQQLATRAWTADEFDDVANRYLGLLDASHMGIRSPKPTAENSQANGRLGATYKRVESGYEVVSIESGTPASQGAMQLQIGDIITAIGFEPIGPADTVSARLAGRVGRETAFTILRQAESQDKPTELYLLITPISYRDYDDIRYDNWQLANKEKVDDLSNGRLGYIHIESMNASSLAEFERDLYAACEGRDGLVIDVRDNGGGWTTDRLLASIMTQRHAYTVPRGADASRTNSYPIDRLFIARYNLPINALCNEHSFSNAEIFSHAFKTLERGTLIGNTTAGGVISTGRARLLDGTTIRLPFRGWYLPDGSDMENNGAVPDLLISQTPEDEAAGRDTQLKIAVQDLLKRLDQ
ncbi:MAG: S41 family peptidase [Phycisphaeraceae bacterium]